MKRKVVSANKITCVPYLNEDQKVSWNYDWSAKLECGHIVTISDNELPKEVVCPECRDSYTLQSGRYGGNWEDEETGRNLKELKLQGMSRDDLDGRYQYRILNSVGEVVWNRIPPYQGKPINTCENGWLSSIQYDYGLDDKILLEEILHWLKETFNEEKNNIHN